MKNNKITEEKLLSFNQVCTDFIYSSPDLLASNTKKEFIENLYKELSIVRENEDYNEKISEFIDVTTSDLYDMTNYFKNEPITLENMISFKNATDSKITAYIDPLIKIKKLDVFFKTGNNVALYDVVSHYFKYHKINDLKIYFKPKYEFSYIPTNGTYNYFSAISSYIQNANNYNLSQEELNIENENLLYVYSKLKEKNNTVLFKKQNLSSIHDDIIFIKNFVYDSGQYITDGEGITTEVKKNVLLEIFENNMTLEDLVEKHFYTRFKEEIIEIYENQLNNTITADIEFNFNQYMTDLNFPLNINDLNISNFKYMLFKYAIASKNSVSTTSAGLEIPVELPNETIIINVLYQFYDEMKKIEKYLNGFYATITNLNGFYLSK